MNFSFKADARKPKNRTAVRVAALAGLTFLVVPLSAAIAQDMSFDLEEAESGKVAAEAEAGGEVSAEAEADTSGDVLSELASTPEEDTAEAAPEREKHTLVTEEIYAVQRIYALRRARLELAPSFSFTVNDQYVSHNAPAVALNFWITNVLAIGANFLWYQGLEDESELTFHIRRSTRLAVPITEYQLGAHFNFTYVPIYGKFSMFNEYIFQWDSYLIGGVGLLRTRPVSVVDPSIRTFDFDIRIAFNVGMGIRVFVTRYLTFFMELRDYMFLEKLESLTVELGPGRERPDTWVSEDATLTHNVAAHVGMTIFFPFGFEYRYPK
jgi:outer membrane beta-barrel protein